MTRWGNMQHMYFSPHLHLRYCPVRLALFMDPAPRSLCRTTNQVCFILSTSTSSCDPRSLELSPSSNWPLSRKLGRAALLHSWLRVRLVTSNVFVILSIGVLSMLKDRRVHGWKCPNKSITRNM